MRTALLIIDIFNRFQFVNGEQLEAETEKIVLPIFSLKQFAKTNQMPVIYINDNLFQKEMPVDAFIAAFSNDSNKKIVQTLKPVADDLFFYKEKFSAFFETNLHTYLQKENVSQLIITGIAGHICVLFTANDAYMRGYKIIAPTDAYACGGPVQKAFVDEMFKHVFHSKMCTTNELIASFVEKEKS